MSPNLRSTPGFIGYVCLVLATAAAARSEEFRTWTDSTGRFEVQAKFVAVDGSQVTIARDNGARITLPLEKLSEADQEYIAKLKSENPFEAAADNRFKPAGPAAGRSFPRPRAPAARGPRPRSRETTVDWSASQVVALDAAGAEWKVEPPEAAPLSFRPKTVALPSKTDFFEKLSGVAVNLAAKKAVVGYTLARHGSAAMTRIVFCDLEQGRTLEFGSAEGQMAPIALHDDGQHVLMRRNEFGFGNLDRLEVWSLEGKQAVPSLVWTPYEDTNGGARDVMWAEFVDARTLATCSRGGRVALWDVATAQPICHFQLVSGAVPALSDDRKWIAFVSRDSVGLFDVENREVVAVQNTPADLTWPLAAFSPSGRQIACIASDRVLVWDTATGQLAKNFATPGVHLHGAIAFPADGFILGANKFLIALDTQLKLWEYQGIEHARTVGGTTYLAVSGFNAPGGLLATQLPHAEAASLLEKAIKQQDLFVFHQGTPVKLNVSGVPAPQQSRVSDALSKKLDEMNCPIQANAAVEVAAGVEGPKRREISYMFVGDYKVQEYRTKVKFLYQGKPIWETSGTNVPAVLTLKRGENVEGVLRKLGAQPSYEFFDRVVLPEFLQKPAGNGGPSGGQTLGRCRVTPTGFR